MIPDTQSVVSRHAVDEENIEDSTPPWYKKWYNNLTDDDANKTKDVLETKNTNEEEHSSEQLPIN